VTDCSRLLEQLSGYLDGELSPEEQTSIESHLRTCPACEAELQGLRSAGVLLRRTLDAQADAADLAGLAARVLAAVDSDAPAAALALPAPGGAVRWLREHRGTLLAVAAAAIVLLGLLLGPLLLPAEAPPAEDDVVVELLDPPEGYDAMIYNDSEEGKNITVIWLIEQEAPAPAAPDKDPSL